MQKITAIIKNKKYYLYRVLTKLNLLSFLNFKTRCTLYNTPFVIPILGGIGYNNLMATEPWMLKLFQKLHKMKPGTFIDIGINTGQTLLKIKSVNSNIPYIGFEPNPNCIYYTQQLIYINKFTNTTILPIGLSNKVGFETLYADSAFSGMASMLKDFRVNYNINTQLKLPVFPLDQITTLTENTGTIKIDVEGYELEVIEGMVNVLQKEKPFIICEILPVYTIETENGKYRYARQQRLQQLLQNLQYSIGLIDESEFILHQLDSLPIHGDMQKTNYLFYPSEKGDTMRMFQFK